MPDSNLDKNYSPELKKKMEDLSMGKNSIENANSDGESKEKKERSPEELKLLGAADVLGINYFARQYEEDIAKAKDEDKDEIIRHKIINEDMAIRLVKKFSKEEIESASMVFEKRQDLKKISERYKRLDKKSDTYERDVKNLKIDKENIEKAHEEEMKNFQVLRMKNEYKRIEEGTGTEDEKKEKKEQAIQSALLMAKQEKLKYQNEDIQAEKVINPDFWDKTEKFFEKVSKNKFFGKYLKLNRYTKMAITTGLFTAILLPSTIAGGGVLAGAGLAAYFAARGLAGTSISMFLSKGIQGWGNWARRKDEAKTQEKLNKLGVNRKYLEKMSTESSDKDEIFKKIADANEMKVNEYAKEMKKHQKYSVINKFVGSALAGYLGGRTGASLTDTATELITGGGGGGPAVETDKTTPEAPVEPTITEETMKMATVGKGEGVEHVFRRQLEANPEAFGFKGDPTDIKAVHEWSGGAAHRIAIDKGYVDSGTGEEIWVKDMGPKGAEGNPAYVLEADGSGKVGVKEFFDGKEIKGGSTSSNPYEFWHSKPKISEVVEQPEPEVVLTEEIPEVVETRPAGGTGQPEAEIGDTPPTPPEMHTYSVSGREALFTDLERNQLPQLEETAGRFHDMSLSEQESILGSPKSAYFKAFLKNLGGDPESTLDQKLLMGRVNQSYEKMFESYDGNIKDFGKAVNDMTELDGEQMNDLLDTKINDLVHTGSTGKVSEFIEKIRPNQQQLADNLTVGEIAKSRFVDGEFKPEGWFIGRN